MVIVIDTYSYCIHTITYMHDCRTDHFCIGQPVRGSILRVLFSFSQQQFVTWISLWLGPVKCSAFHVSRSFDIDCFGLVDAAISGGGGCYSADFLVLWLLNSFCLFFQEVLWGPVIEDTAYLGNRIQKNQAGSGLKASFLLCSFQFLKALCKLLREGSNNSSTLVWHL